MTEVGVNLGFLFTELPLHDRFRAAVEAGCPLVELPWPARDSSRLPQSASNANAQIVQLNVDAGDLSAGSRGFAHLPPLRHAWRESFLDAARIAEEARIARLNVLAGIAQPELPRASQLECLAANLAWAADQLDGTGTTIVVEHLNEKENPGYLLSDPADLHSFLGRFDGAIRAQLDLHHLTLAGAGLAHVIALFDGLIGHVQLSDHPGRGAPGTGSINWAETLSCFAAAGYPGPWMLEYEPPAGESRASLSVAIAALSSATPTPPSGEGT
jgi:hydroxypyruvate isomerase